MPMLSFRIKRAAGTIVLAQRRILEPIKGDRDMFPTFQDYLNRVGDTPEELEIYARPIYEKPDSWDEDVFGPFKTPQVLLSTRFPSSNRSMHSRYTHTVS